MLIRECVYEKERQNRNKGGDGTRTTLFDCQMLLSAMRAKQLAGGGDLEALDCALLGLEFSLHL